MGTAVLTIALIALVAGLALSYASRKLPSSPVELVEQVNDKLPQTQCAQCGYPGCRPYAAAIVNDGAGINLCPPGGDDTVRRLADLLGRDVVPLVDASPAGKLLAVIDESLCIGCTHCRNACPVDAIVGAQQLMHSVIDSECTGCELCVAPCPVDCISMQGA
jgi:electron transport complex protein RnfB